MVLPLSPVAASSATAYSSRSPTYQTRHKRAGSETYYEDVDPRFAQDPAPQQSAVHPAHRESGIPNALTPGPGQRAVYNQGPAHQPAYLNGGQQHYRMNSPSPIDTSRVLAPHAEEDDAGNGRQATDQYDSDEFLSSQQQAQRMPYEANVTPPSDDQGRRLSLAGSEPGVRTVSGGYLDAIPDGARSPAAASESSHFTSVSQRGINPNWRPGMPVQGPPGYGQRTEVTSASAVQRRKEDVILSANPDFSLPAVGRGGGRGRGMRGRGGGVPAPATGLTPAGRYPTPDVGMSTG